MKSVRGMYKISKEKVLVHVDWQLLTFAHMHIKSFRRKLKFMNIRIQFAVIQRT